MFSHTWLNARSADTYCENTKINICLQLEVKRHQTKSFHSSRHACYFWGNMVLLVMKLIGCIEYYGVRCWVYSIAVYSALSVHLGIIDNIDIFMYWVLIYLVLMYCVFMYRYIEKIDRKNNHDSAPSHHVLVYVITYAYQDIASPAYCSHSAILWLQQMFLLIFAAVNAELFYSSSAYR